MANHHQSELLDLYYTYIHPSLPILEDKENLSSAIAHRSVPKSLLAAIYCAAIGFWELSPGLHGSEPPVRRTLYRFVFSSVTLEARTPSLRTVQALLLYLQIPPFHIREPNHPGFWALTGQVRNSVEILVLI